MPAIREIYWVHPDTAEAGLWVRRLDGSIIGRSLTELEALRPTTGAPATRIARFRQAVIDRLQPQFETRTPLLNWAVEDQAKIIASPGAFCRIDGADHVSQDSVVDIEAISLSPLRFNITISEGASKAEWKYA